MASLSDGSYAMVRQIAEDENIPAPFLAKILQQLARKGMLKSSKGPAGGFALPQSPKLIRLIDIVEALDGVPSYYQCPLGHSPCAEDTPCAMHDSWVGLRSRIMEYLERNTVADLAAALEKKKRGKAPASRTVKRASAGSKRG